MSNGNEVWKPIPGCEGRYEVSSLGRVRSLLRGGRIMKPANYGRGYLMVAPTVNGRSKPCKVHHLVLLAFAGPRPAGTVACHANDIPDDNRAENLRWDTPVANARDRRRNGGYVLPLGEMHKSAKLTDAQAIAIFHDQRHYEVIASEYGVSRFTVYGIKVGRNWNHVTGLERKRRAVLKEQP